MTQLILCSGKGTSLVLQIWIKLQITCQSKMMRLFVLFVVFLSTVTSQKRWYYTGAYKNEQSKNLFFNGARMQHSDLYHFGSQLNDDVEFWTPQLVHNESFLYAGGSFLRLKSVNSTVSDQLLEVIKLEVASPNNESFILNSAVFYSQIIAFNYGEAVQLASCEVSSDDFLLTAEVGLYDHSIDKFLERYWKEIGTGEFVAITATTTHVEENRNTERKHRVIFAIDVLGRATLVKHTWKASPVSDSATVEDTAASTPADAAVPLRVMTYNLWHNNPPSWIYRDK